MLQPDLNALFRSALERAGLATHHDALLPHARACAHFFYHNPADHNLHPDDLPPGSSRLGGEPDLPDSVAWPPGTDDDGNAAGHAHFLAQFNLADLPPIADFPRTGHLWLFHCNPTLTQAPAAVIYRDHAQPLRRRANPTRSKPQRFGWTELSVATLTFQPGVSLPFSSRRFQHQFRDLPLHQLHKHLTASLDSPAPRNDVDGQIGGYSYQAEIDICRDHALAQQFDRDGLLTDELRRRLPDLAWIIDHEPQIAALADSLQLLASFRPNRDIGLDVGDGMYLDILLSRQSLASLDFSPAFAALPMLL